MTAEFGLFCLIVVLLASCMQFSFLFAGRFKPALTSVMASTSWLQAFATSLALASLMILRIESDFSVENVAEHSNRTLPMLYKIVGTWGNHEGSMLLWLLIMAVFAGLLTKKMSQQPETILHALAVQAGLVAGTCGFILFTSNPFARIFPPPWDGKALNPLLQDIGLAIHPPLLYVGYVGFSIVFSLAVAALITGKAGSSWAKLVHPWILLSWAFLTAGIGLGSWWAYRELGWGGWWFWDPVENASLLPWLAGVALLHSNIVLKKRGALASWVLLLAILTFALSLIGTFLVRSGALTSVHSFASDPARGVYILVFILVSVGSALALYALRGGTVQAGKPAAPISREGFIILNNAFVLAACATVLLGTIYPLIIDWLDGRPLAVGAPYFNATFLPLMALPVCLAAIAPFAQWGQAKLRRDVRQLMPALLATGAVWFLVMAVAHTHVVWALLGFGLATWLASGSVLLIIRKRSAIMLPVCVAHFGVALMVAGITGEGLWKTHKEVWLKQGEAVTIGDYDLTLRSVQKIGRANHAALKASFDVVRNEQSITLLEPEYRRYAIRDVTTSESAIHSSLAGDIYAVIGETSADGQRLSTRVYHVPMIVFIWLGFALMAAGGIMAAFQNRKSNIRV